ncbi:hypothetical protein THAOC_23315 [Thalassiosira oceanica]|uniref:Uncharacterized protein n=1 Tax=Thalassiosira oceanica TaxID=159749 RepID=K0S789_THAOC|nr:hypothetical protein THAOC_23315 [Thalassiosira oceanica]|eukprot:EJK56741.1 hypothetical protein THAOC_23315 [Thalassiosira oceanica]
MSKEETGAADDARTRDGTSGRGFEGRGVAGIPDVPSPRQLRGLGGGSAMSPEGSGRGIPPCRCRSGPTPGPLSRRTGEHLRARRRLRSLPGSRDPGRQWRGGGGAEGGRRTGHPKEGFLAHWTALELREGRGRESCRIDVEERTGRASDRPPSGGTGRIDAAIDRRRRTRAGARPSEEDGGLCGRSLPRGRGTPRPRAASKSVGGLAAKGGRRTGHLSGRGSVRPYEKGHGKAVSEHHLGLGFRKCDNQHDRKHPKIVQPE